MTADYNPRIEADAKITQSIEQRNDTIVRNKLIESIREILLNRNEKPTYHLGKNIHHTCFPNGSTLVYQFDMVC